MAGGPDQGLGRHQRLTRSALFKEAYDQGQKWVGRYLILFLRSGEGASLRLGVVTGRKVGAAVSRSRARRRLREAFRRNRAELEGPFDVVLVARQAILRAKWADLVDELMTLARRAGIHRHV